LISPGAGVQEQLFFHVKMPVAEQTIAIVDDDVRFNRALERLLRASGFETNTFGSAEEFLANHTAQSHACLILDVHLPGMSGFELFDRLSAFDPWLPVIFVTADSREGIRHQAYPISDAICLQKPFAGAVLLEAVRAQLGRRHFDTE
jgi:FixJ family two-component response regulator